MKKKTTIVLPEIKPHKRLPSHLVVTRTEPSKKLYNRKKLPKLSPKRAAQH